MANGFKPIQEYQIGLVKQDLAVEFEIIKKAGSWFSYGDTKLGQGRDAVKALIKDNPELADELEEKIKAKIKENNA